MFRKIAIVGLFVILLIMPYYSLCECLENPNYDDSLATKNDYDKLYTKYITLFNDGNQALNDENDTGYKQQFDNLFSLITITH